MKWLNHIELNIAFFAVVLNFIWEMQQMTLFSVSGVQSINEAVWGCTRATLGDALILLIAFWLVAVYAKSRRWIFTATRHHVLIFIVLGVLITIVIELLSTTVFNRWQYRDVMPTFPGLDVGIVPLLQWVLLPPFILWLVRRQLGGVGNIGCR